MNDNDDDDFYYYQTHPDPIELKKRCPYGRCAAKFVCTCEKYPNGKTKYVCMTCRKPFTTYRCMCPNNPIRNK